MGADDKERLDRLQKRIRDLTEHLRAVEEEVDQLRRQTSGPPVPPATGPATGLHEEELSASESAQASQPEWQPVSRSVRKRAARPEPRSSDAPVKKRGDLEAMVGGNLLAKVGITVFVIGVVFFLKLAFDQGWIGPQMRIALGIGGGLALAAIGDVLGRRERVASVYAQVLTGGGAVITYFTTYASYGLPDYRVLLGVSLPLVSVALGAIALSLAGYAFWRRLPVLAAESVLLGASAAIIGNGWSVFSLVYIVLLAGAVGAVAVVRGWRAVAVAVLVSSTVSLIVGAIEDVPAGPTLVAAALIAGVGIIAAARAGWREASPLSLALVHAVALVLLALDAPAPWLFVGVLAVFQGAVLWQGARGDAPAAVNAAGVSFAVVMAVAVFPMEHAAVWFLASAVAGVGALLAIAHMRSWPGTAVVAVVPFQLVSWAVIASRAVESALMVGALVAPAVLVAAFAWRDPPKRVLAAVGLATHAVLFFTLEGSALPSVHRIIATLAVTVAVSLLAVRPLAARAALVVTLPGTLLLGLPDGAPTLRAVAAVILALSVVPLALRRRVDDEEAPAFPFLTGAATLGGWAVLMRVLVLDYSGEGGWATALFAAGALLLAVLPLAARPARIGWATAGMVLAVAWPPIHFDGSGTVYAWTALLATGAFAALRYRTLWLRAVLAVVSLLVAVHLWVVEFPDLEDGAFPVGAGALVAAAAAGAMLLARALAPTDVEPWLGLGAADRRRTIVGIDRGLLALPLLVVAVFFSAWLEGVLIALAWAVEATVVVLAGFAIGNRDVRLAGLALFGMVIARLAIVDVWDFEAVYRVITFLAVGALALVVSFLYARRRRSVQDDGQAPLVPPGEPAATPAGKRSGRRRT